MEQVSTGWTLSHTAYERLRSVVQLILPAFATLYFTFAGIWGLPYGEQVVGSAAALATFGGALLRVSKKNYDKAEEQALQFDGDLVVVNRPDGGMRYELELNGDPGDIPFVDKVSFKVVHRNHD